MAKENETYHRQIYKSVKIVHCACVHEVQDKIYGHGNRVANRCGKEGAPSYRCTVCKREHQ